MGKLSNKSEARIQQECLIWYRNRYCLKHHEPRHLIFSVPNEGKSKIETIRKKAIGMMPGVSDLIVVRPGETLFVEVKTGKGRQTASQKEFQKTVEAIGFQYFLVRSLDDFKNSVTFVE